MHAEAVWKPVEEEPLSLSCGTIASMMQMINVPPLPMSPACPVMKHFMDVPRRLVFFR
jgi:hypothetical protein